MYVCMCLFLFFQALHLMKNIPWKKLGIQQHISQLQNWILETHDEFMHVMKMVGLLSKQIHNMYIDRRHFDIEINIV